MKIDWRKTIENYNKHKKQNKHTIIENDNLDDDYSEDGTLEDFFIEFYKDYLIYE